MGKAALFALRVVKAASFFILVLLLVQGAALFLLQNRIIYHESRYASDMAVSLFQRKLVLLGYDLGTAPQTAFYAPPADGSVPDHIWVLYSGNGGKVLEYGDLVSQPALARDGFLLVDYPGYGFNGGTPSPDATQAATQLAIGRLAQHLGLPLAAVRTRLNAVGHSLGTGAALGLAVNDPAIRHVVLIAPFTSLCAMARRVVGYPVCAFIHHNMDEEAMLNTLATREPRPTVTVFNGTDDNVIPPAMGQKLAADHPDWIGYHSLTGAGHIDIVNNPRVAPIAEEMATVERTP